MADRPIHMVRILFFNGGPGLTSIVLAETYIRIIITW
jgi:hypothetical protein